MKYEMYPFAVNGTQITNDPFAGTDREMFDQLADEMVSPVGNLWMDEQGILHTNTLDGGVNGQEVTRHPFGAAEEPDVESLVLEHLPIC